MSDTVTSPRPSVTGFRDLVTDDPRPAPPIFRTPYTISVQIHTSMRTLVQQCHTGCFLTVYSYCCYLNVES